MLTNPFRQADKNKDTAEVTKERQFWNKFQTSIEKISEEQQHTFIRPQILKFWDLKKSLCFHHHEDRHDAYDRT